MNEKSYSFPMHYELSWPGKESKTETFRTGCPKIAEIMLLSGADIPRMRPDVHEKFVERFGGKRGEFEAILVRHAQDNRGGAIDSQVEGVTIHVRNSDNDLQTMQ